MPADRRLLRAYVDETGDRGTSAKSSRFFAMVAVVVADEDEGDLRTTVQALRRNLSVPANKPLHWQEHVKTFRRRQYVAGQLSMIERLRLNYVIFEKAAMPQDATLVRDQEAFYNYAAGILLERIVLTAKDWAGGPREVVVTFGHVRGFDHSKTVRYFEGKRRSGPDWLPWNLLHSHPRFAGMGDLDGLQAADMYAGALNSAVREDEFGGFEPQHLLAVRHQIRRRNGQSWGNGFKVLARHGTMEAFPWWPADGI